MPSVAFEKEAVRSPRQQLRRRTAITVSEKRKEKYLHERDDKEEEPLPRPGI